jgi:hypothetical protein
MQAFKMTDRHWDDDLRDLVQLLRKAVPELRTETSRNQFGPEASPVAALRELGDRVLAEVIHRRSGYRRSENRHNHYGLRLLTAFGRYLKKKIVMPFVLIAAIYIGLRLFGGAEVLQILDQLEARLLVGWQRLMTYVKSLI